MSYLFLNLIYPIAARIVYIIIPLLPKSTKVYRWYRARSGIQKKSEMAFHFEQKPDHLLCYCSSLGEFEMIRDIIRRLKSEFDTLFIEVVFFSPSGYDFIDVEDSTVDSVNYSPFETKKAVKAFFATRKPRLVMIAGNAIWPVFMNFLISKKIPYIFLGSYFGKETFLKSVYYKLMSPYLKGASYIYVQSARSVKYLHSLGIEQSIVGGNPRLSSIKRKSEKKVILRKIEIFQGQHQVIVCGSTHGKDEKFISDVIPHFEAYKWIIVPHEADEKSLKRVKAKFPHHVLYSEDPDPSAKIMIIDQNGLLKHIYRYGTLAYIGGGHDKGIHNILEAAVFGGPVIFGPRYRKFQEAHDLLEMGRARSFNNSTQLEAAISEGLGQKVDNEEIDNYFESQEKLNQSISTSISTLLTKEKSAERF